jgi:hypothetical protein
VMRHKKIAAAGKNGTCLDKFRRLIAENRHIGTRFAPGRL